MNPVGPMIFIYFNCDNFHNMIGEVLIGYTAMFLIEMLISRNWITVDSQINGGNDSKRKITGMLCMA